MEIRIGIVQSPRELTIESDLSADELHALVANAMSEGTPFVSFTDNKGKQLLIATASISYVEFGGEIGRRVGFVS